MNPFQEKLQSKRTKYVLIGGTFVFIVLAGLLSSDESGAGSGNEPPSIKGIQLGMPIDEALAKLDPYLTDYARESMKRSTTESGSTRIVFWMRDDTLYSCSLYSDPAGRLTELDMSNDLIVAAFNAKAVAPEKFVEVFMENYGIPAFEQTAQAHANPLAQFGGSATLSSNQWIYRAPGDWAIVIDGFDGELRGFQYIAIETAPEEHMSFD